MAFTWHEITFLSDENFVKLSDEPYDTLILHVRQSNVYKFELLKCWNVLIEIEHVVMMHPLVANELQNYDGGCVV